MEAVSLRTLVSIWRRGFLEALQQMLIWPLLPVQISLLRMQHHVLVPRVQTDVVPSSAQVAAWFQQMSVPNSQQNCRPEALSVVHALGGAHLKVKPAADHVGHTLAVAFAVNSQLPKGEVAGEVAIVVVVSRRGWC